MTRALRILLVANDGFSAGHVVRTLAIGRGLARGAARRGIELSTVLVTTSEADTLLANEPVAVVRLPSPGRARAAGLTDADRRRLVGAAITATADSFAPDLIVVDTFPNGPHGELAGLDRTCKRALVRRAVPDERVELLTSGLGNYDRMILVDDAGFAGTGSSVPSVIVPPITLDAPALARDAARHALDLPPGGRVIAVAAGGGGDADGATIARTLANTIAALEPEATVVLALGPLALAPTSSAGPSTIAATIESRLRDDVATVSMRPLDRPRRTEVLAAGAADPSPTPNVRRSVDDIGMASIRPLGQPTRDALVADRIAVTQTAEAAAVDPSHGVGPGWARDPRLAVPTQTLAVGSGATGAQIRELRVTPLQRYLAAFDAVVSSAGYNTAHELAAARVPAILFPLPRPFDDQSGRALRLTAAGHAYLLAKHDDAAIAKALAWARTATCPGLVSDGADRAADALFDLVGAS